MAGKGFGNDFLNLSTYMNANQGGGQNLANQATGALTGSATTAKTSADNALTNYNNKLVPFDPNNPTTFNQPAPMESDPNWAQAQNSLQQFNAAKNGLNSATGSGAALGAITGTKGAGNQGFNAALFGGAGGQQQVGGAVAGAGDLAGYLSGDQTTAKQYLNNAYNTHMDDYNNYMYSLQKPSSAQPTDPSTGFRERLSNGVGSPIDMSMAGTVGESGKNGNGQNVKWGRHGWSSV